MVNRLETVTLAQSYSHPQGKGYTPSMNEIEQMKQHARRAVMAARDGIPASERIRRSAWACEKLEERFAAHLQQPRRQSTLQNDGTTSFSTIDNLAPKEKPTRQKQTCLQATEQHPLIAVYAAMKSEVSVDSFVRHALQRNWRLCFPCMVKPDEPEPTPKASAAPSPSAAVQPERLHAHAARPNHSIMEFYLVNSKQLENPDETFLAHPLRSFTHEELTQAGFQPAAPEQIDAVVVPLVAFDDSGNRLGYGGGNYDRLLANLRSDAIVAGIAFAEQRLAHLPIEEHDRPLPTIIVA